MHMLLTVLIICAYKKKYEKRHCFLFAEVNCSHLSRSHGVIGYKTQAGKKRMRDISPYLGLKDCLVRDKHCYTLNAFFEISHHENILCRSYHINDKAILR